MIDYLPEALVEMTCIVYLTLTLYAIAEIGIEHAAYHAGQDAGEPEMFADDVYRSNVYQADEDLLYGILGTFEQLEGQIGHGRSNHKGPQYFLAHQQDEVLMGTGTNHALDEYEEHDTCTVVEQAFTFNDTGHTLGKSQLV